MFKDLTGQKFERLRVIKRIENYVSPKGNSQAQWLCECECGNYCKATSTTLISGHKRSCGCLLKDTAREKGKKKKIHGLSKTRLHNIWIGIKNRCYNPKNHNYKRYGGRGITICPEWRDDFMAFHDWAMANNYKDGLTIDRINVNGNYTPENCRWVDYKIQANNRRNTNLITYKGETKSITEWEKTLNMGRDRLRQRLFVLNWSIEKAFNTPKKKNKYV